MQEILDHLEAIGRPARNICFVEPKYAGSGIDEQEDVARYFHDQYGLKVMHADPAELTLRGRRGLLRRRRRSIWPIATTRWPTCSSSAKSGVERAADADAVPAEPR